MVYLAAKEAGWDSTAAEYARRASAQFMEYWRAHTHAYENYPPEGKVNHDFLYVNMWGGRESHYVWAAMQVLCELEEIFGLELDGRLRFGNPHLARQSTWKGFFYQGRRTEAEAGPERVRVAVEGAWELTADTGAGVRHCENGPGRSAFSLTVTTETVVTLSSADLNENLFLNDQPHAFEKRGNQISFKVPPGRARVRIG